VMPITPLARRCESSWLLISSTTICRFTAGRIRFCQYVSAGPKIHGLVGHDRLQPPVLFLELAQPAHFRHLQTAVLAAPGVERRVRDPVRGYSSAIFAPPSASFRIVMICSSRSRAGLMLAFVPRQTYRDTLQGGNTRVTSRRSTDRSLPSAMPITAVKRDTVADQDVAPEPDGADSGLTGFTGSIDKLS
jgi:hypothetical protein